MFTERDERMRSVVALVESGGFNKSVEGLKLNYCSGRSRIDAVS